jgi:hypothetical protein
MPLDDGWDWPYLYYAGRTIIRLSEEEFWRRTSPRKLKALLDVHMEYKGSNKSANPIEAFIDDIM